MMTGNHLWAIAFDDTERADKVREEIDRLGWDEHYLCLLDMAVVVRHLDGSFTVNRKPFPAIPNILGCTATGFLAGIVLATPLTGAALGAALGSVGTATAAQAGIGEKFIRDVEKLMEPGTSALFVLDDEGDMELILHRIRGLGGTIVRTNVDAERAKLIQSALAGASANGSEVGTR
jgi:uncharacterized membrane protein